MTTLVAAAGALGLLLVYVGISTPPSPRSSRVLDALDRICAEAGLARLSGRRLLALSSSSFALTFMLIAGLTSSPGVALAFACADAYVPVAVVRSRGTRRRRMLREAWPDAIADLTTAVRAGISLPESCMQLGERGPEGLRNGFGALAATYRSSGSFEAALARLRDVLADPVADRVAAALSLAHQVGGTDLVRVLRTLGDFVREDLRVRKEIEARWSWTVTAARVAAGSPWLVLLIMSTRAEAAVAYNSSAGLFVIAGGAAATFAGYRLMLRAARLPEERRLGQ
jgi:tight adherence protein B